MKARWKVYSIEEISIEDLWTSKDHLCLVLKEYNSEFFNSEEDAEKFIKNVSVDYQYKDEHIQLTIQKVYIN